MDGLVRETLVVVSADLDDESPQVLATVQVRALELGALDCVLFSTHMKKGRAGTRIEVLCREESQGALARLLVEESSTLGVRIGRVERFSLPRVMRHVVWRGERIAVKLALSGGRVLRAMPEHDDCLRASGVLGVPLREVLEGVRAAALSEFPPGCDPAAGE